MEGRGSMIRPLRGPRRVSGGPGLNTANFRIAAIRPSKARALAENWVRENRNVREGSLNSSVSQGVVNQRVTVTWRSIG